jgi:NTE family protein
MNKVGLVLSGGGVRGFAHVGVIKILDKLKVKPTCVSGCSMGAIIGVFYCLGYSGEEIEKISESINLKEILKVSLNRKVKGNKFENYFNTLFKNKNFEDLSIPLYINSVDIETGEEIIFNKGNLAKAVSASMAIPGIFKSATINGRTLVDGGVKNNIPLKILLDQKLDKIIVVNTGQNKTPGSVLEKISYGGENKTFPFFSKVIVKSFLIMLSNEHMLNFSKQNSDIFIAPKLEGYNLLDFNKIKEIINQGESAAKKQRKKIINLFKSQPIMNFFIRKFGGD